MSPRGRQDLHTSLGHFKKRVASVRSFSALSTRAAEKKAGRFVGGESWEINLALIFTSFFRRAAAVISQGVFLVAWAFSQHTCVAHTVYVHSAHRHYLVYSCVLRVCVLQGVWGMVLLIRGAGNAFAAPRIVIVKRRSIRESHP